MQVAVTHPSETCVVRFHDGGLWYASFMATKKKKMQNMTHEELDFIANSLWSAMPYQTNQQAVDALNILIEAYEDAADALRG